MITKRFFKTKNEVEVTFEVEVPQNTVSVALVADFLDWQPQPMKKVAKSNIYKFKTRLPKESQFQYRYLLDEQEWMNDTQADAYVANEFGEDNCVLCTAQ
ncbi:isoamylase early set domain-containing protein [Vibrio cincinnatiensis]|nr:isoamylase early set domain-containing protein [Vibrio cincinnatiensis]MCG3723943.1 1,4-alpha-glucan branching protein [Vibrio cincinnatiensis]MCG3732294.1 1,4-alpha-glucan branching protein [Vibrio cincinnatiensis]MCG3737008.1 1,4-alpha-glucan branching protein [Vibrio cincinnatiensis]MCG3738913.1 1,4-alpha-glucan branching protein [Vibrio cincinnatiensis]MCG3742046.1 1,4-alpha-glucan branching protein [Vibrio cincinnatiensis]